jgi:hypothetical protein
MIPERAGMLSICEWLQHSSTSRQILESNVGFAALIITHMLGLGVFLGTVMILDLRLLGRGIRTSPVSDLVDRLLPWTRAGFAAMAISGVILFCTEAVKCYQSRAFGIKMGLIALATVNVWVFHRRSYSASGASDAGSKLPLSWKLAGALSLLLWLGALAAGRAVGYDL